MKLPFKPDRKLLIVAGVVALVVVGLMGGGSDPRDAGPAGLDEDGRQAYTDFADGYPDARSKPERLAVADRVLTSSRRTGHDVIAERAMDLGAEAGTGGSAWRAAADAFEAACRDAGWAAT